MASSVTGNVMPTGCKVFTTIPDLFFIPEFVFGGLVWTLVASTHVRPDNPQGWVMFVSIFCFIMTTLWFFIFICGGNQSSVWPALDAAYHFIAVVLYLSAAVVLAVVTISFQNSSGTPFFKTYQENIAAVVMAYVATLLYFIHAIFSAIRWKSS
ncbi:myelin and lymphocyte protein-like [Chanos chanos]|uniref:Myelin and lymphocyte protein n=1 Tax=Chanos chanos TaxID=29144 RepID=A0A6J2WEQ3_CHACN|nr:myelin and lymphocyte protein-like [Chanos chanos]